MSVGSRKWDFGLEKSERTSNLVTIDEMIEWLSYDRGIWLIGQELCLLGSSKQLPSCHVVNAELPSDSLTAE